MEGIVAQGGLAAHRWSSWSCAGRKSFQTLGGSLPTLPVLWFVLPSLLLALSALLVGKALAVVVEALLHWRLLPARPLPALILSVAANLAFYWVGLLVF